MPGPGRVLRLDLEYDGARFAGWAAQPGLRTVEGVLRDALSTLLREPAELSVAVRTDAGVHASGHVVSVPTAGDAEPSKEEANLLARLSARLRREPAEGSTDR